jgi:hypothetical protein
MFVSAMEWKMRTFGIFYGTFVYLVVIWYNYLLFLYAVPRKIWQPWFLNPDQGDQIGRIFAFLR